MKGNANRKPARESKLTAKQERGIVALLANTKLKDAAASAGISEATLWRWLQEPDFHAAYMKARRDAVQSAIARLQSYTSDAVDTLHEIMMDKDALAFARLGAARAILDYSIRGVELEDHEQRLAEIERLMAAQQPRK